MGKNTYAPRSKKKFDPEERREELTRKPTRPWKAPQRKKAMLSYTIVMEHDPAVGALAHRLLGHAQTVNAQHRGPTEITVRQADDVVRLEGRGAGVFGQNFVYITDPEQGLLFLDTADKLYLHLEPSQRLDVVLEPVKATITVERPAAKRGSAPRAVVEFSTPVRARFLLWLEPDRKLREHGAAIFKTLFACGDRLHETGLDCRQLAKEGVPTRGELHIEQEPGVFRKVSWFELRDLTLEDYRAEPFTIPEGYEDYRSAPRRPEDNGYVYGKPRRLSELRRAPRRPPRKERPPEGAGMTEVARAHRGIVAMTPVREGNLDFPQCLPSTYGSQLGNLVDQKLLDDARYVANGVSRRLTGFSGSGGLIDVDWLAQFQIHAEGLNSGAGSGLFFLLRDPDLNGEGLLDKLSESSVRRLLVDGNLSGLALPAALLAAANGVIANTAIAPEDRFDNLSPADQQALREAYLQQRIAHLQLTYPDSTPTTSIFYDLINVKLLSIDFDIDINNESIVRTLEWEGDHLHLLVALSSGNGKAWMGRWPTAKLWTILGVSTLGCFLFPPACLLAAAAATVIVFLALDFAYVSVELKNLEIDAEVRFTPNASNVLQPDISLSLDADVSVFYGSVVPTGIHQILSLIYSIIGSHMDVVINQLESQLRSKLQSLLRDDLAITYPPKFGPIPLSALSNLVEFTAQDRMFIQTGLNAGLLGVTNPFITQVDSEIKEHILTLRDDFKARFKDPAVRFQEAGNLFDYIDANFDEVARYYLGSVISQNFINHFIHTLWRNQAFTYQLSEPETQQVLELLALAFPDLADQASGIRREASVWPAVSPRTMLTPKLSSKGGPYATTFFDDVRLCVGFLDERRELRRMEFLFAARLFTQLGFGGVNRSTGKLDLVKTTDRIFDLYFDLSNVGVSVIHPEIQAFRTPNMKIDAQLDYSGLDELAAQEAFALALAFALADRRDTVIPAQSGTANLHRYNVGADAFQVVAQLVPFKQNLYVSLGASGVATAIYEGALDLDQLERFDALLIRAFIPTP